MHDALGNHLLAAESLHLPSRSSSGPSCWAATAEIEAHLTSASTSTISKRLDEFEDSGLISRTQYNEIPPRVEYALTEDGYEVRERLEPLLEWAEQQQ
jgi:DNA-binding HxlR family transcriptional regulator